MGGLVQRTANKRASGWMAIVLLSAFPGSGAAQPGAARGAEHVVRLSESAASAERPATIVAPGRGQHQYNVFYIDTRSFPVGGVLDVDVTTFATNGTDASFDLYQGGAPIPQQGEPVGSLAGRYNIRRGTSTRLQLRFKSGQVFALGLEGNWDSPAGARGEVQFRASVEGYEPAPAPVSEGSHDLVLVPNGAPLEVRAARIVAPGMREHHYNLYLLDLRRFWSGGTLVVELKIAPESATDGSFDLFDGAPLLPSGQPATRSLAGRYDVRRGSGTRMEYKFAGGRMVQLGLEGNWFSPKGATGLVRFRVSVRP